MSRTFVVEPAGGASPNEPIDYAKELNPQQLEAVQSLMGPALVIAGAGSGKTRTLTYRVAYLIENDISPENILLLTFTNKAAREMLERVEDVSPGSTIGIWGGTFHSIGARILRRHAEKIGYQPSFTILDSDDQKTVIAKVIKENHLAKKAEEASGEKFPKPQVVGGIFSLAANMDVTVKELLAEQYAFFEETDASILRAHKLYSEKKLESNVMDFDDLLVNFRKLLRDNDDIREYYQSQFQFILVDEYQDTNAVQGEIIDMLARAHHNVMVVGDDAQSIYSWRGADFRNILEFPERYKEAKVYKIETNYRSRPEILELANEAITANTEQFPKELVSARESKGMKPALIPLYDPSIQARVVAQRIRQLRDEGVPYDEMAVLYRSHFQSMEVQMQLTTEGIPFVITSGLRFFEQAHVKDVASFMRFIHNPRDPSSFERMCGMLPGIGPASAGKLFNQWIDHLAATGDRMPESFEELMEDWKVPARSRAAWEQLLVVLDEMAGGDDKATPEQMIFSVREGIYDDFMRSAFDNPETRKQDLEQFQNFAEGFSDLGDFLEQMALLGGSEGDPRQDRRRSDEPSVTLSSVHQAKGLEWKAVFVIWLADGMFPNKRAIDEGGLDSLEEERRLFYVAVTRAKDELYLLYPEMWPRARGADPFQVPSRFLGDFSADLVEEWKVRG